MIEWFENNEGQVVQISKVKYFHHDQNEKKIYAVFDQGFRVSAMPKDGKRTADELWLHIKRKLHVKDASEEGFTINAEEWFDRQE